MDPRSRQYSTMRDDDPWRHRQSQPMTMTMPMTADYPGFGFASGGGNGVAIATDHRQGQGRSSDWDSRSSRHDGRHFSQQIGSSDCAHAHTAAANRSRQEGNSHRYSQAAPHHTNYNDINYNSNNHHHHHHRRINNNDIPTTKIARAPKHRAKQDLPGPAGAYFRQQRQKAATIRQSQHDISIKKVTMAVDASLPEQSTRDDSSVLPTQPFACKSNTDPIVDSDRVGRIIQGGIVTQALQIISKTGRLQQQLHSSPSKEIVVDDIDSPSEACGDDKFCSKRQQQQELFHDYSSDLHECNAWNVMCTALNRIVPPLHHVMLSLSAVSYCHYDQKKSDTTYSTKASSPSPSAVVAYYKNILRTNIPDNYALIYEIHAGKYDVCHCFDSTSSTGGGAGGAGGGNGIDGGAVLHTNDLRIPFLVGYVASVQCHAHSDWTALLVDEMYSVGTNNGGSKGSGGCGGSGGGNASRGILCWIEERLVKQHPNWIRPGSVWMLEGAKLALFTSACEEDDDGSDDNQDDICDDGNAAATVDGTDTSPSTDNARSRSGLNNIDRMILTGESSMLYAWTPEEATIFSDDEFLALSERRFNLSLPIALEDGLNGGMVEGGYCGVAGDDLRDVSILGAKAIGSALVQPGHDKSSHPANSAIDRSSRVSSNGRPYIGSHSSRETDSGGDKNTVISSHAEESLDVRCLSGSSASHEMNENASCGGDELLELMQLSRQAVDQCEDRGKNTNNVDEAGILDDNHSALQIAQAKDMPPPLPIAMATTTTTTTTEGTTSLLRPVVHDRARPVSSESMTSTPLNLSQPQNKLESSNDEVNNPELDVDNSFDDGKMNDSDLVQTPKQKRDSSPSQLHTCTGNDSFDDMLDEEFVVTPCGIDQCNTITGKKSNEFIPLQPEFDNMANTNSYASSDANTPREASLLFDSLDGDDMDCLSEEDD